MKTALVTGSTGFLGSALCEALQSRGWSVVGLSRGNQGASAKRPSSHLSFDLGATGERLDLPHGIDLVFHLAAKAHAVAEVSSEGADYERINLEGTRQVVRAAVEAGAGGIVYVSSVKVFGENQQRSDRPLHEADEPIPDTPYGVTKLAAETVVLGSSALAHRVVIRPSLVYGPGVKGNLARMWAAVGRGRFPLLPETHRLRSIVHRDDLCAALIRAGEMSRAHGRIYHLTDGKPLSARGMLNSMRSAQGLRSARWAVPMVALRAAARAGDTVGRMRGRRFPIDSAVLGKLVGPAWFCSERITTELGWKPERNFLEAVGDLGKPAVIEVT